MTMVNLSRCWAVWGVIGKVEARRVVEFNLYCCIMSE